MNEHLVYPVFETMSSQLLDFRASLAIHWDPFWQNLLYYIVYSLCDLHLGNFIYKLFIIAYIFTIIQAAIHLLRS